MSDDEIMNIWVVHKDNGSTQASTGHPTPYGCACVSRDARNCTLLRYGWCGNFGAADAACECLCHQWVDDEEGE